MWKCFRRDFFQSFPRAYLDLFEWTVAEKYSSQFLPSNTSFPSKQKSEERICSQGCFFFQFCSRDTYVLLQNFSIYSPQKLIWSKISKFHVHITWKYHFSWEYWGRNFSQVVWGGSSKVFLELFFFFQSSTRNLISSNCHFCRKMCDRHLAKCANFTQFNHFIHTGGLWRGFEFLHITSARVSNCLHSQALWIIDENTYLECDENIW